jgi:hypothetical protein
MKKTLMILALTVGLSGIAAYAAEPANKGTVNITVLDENGTLVPDAPVYIYGEHKTKFVGGKDIPGTTTLEMPAGTYRISSALVKHTGDYIDRFASHEAHIEVIAGDNAVVVLTLRPIADAAVALDYAELSPLGVSDKVARALN